MQNHFSANSFNFKLTEKEEIDNGYHCDFCSGSFKTKHERKLHTTEHFQTKSCTKCNTFLIQIADDWFELHSDSNCCKIVQITDNADDDSVKIITKVDPNDFKDTLEVDTDEQCDLQINRSSSSSFVDEDSNNFVSVTGSMNDGNTSEEKILKYNKRKKKTEPLKDAIMSKAVEKNTIEESTKEVKEKHNCEICNKSYLHKVTLQNHMRTIHNPDETTKLLVTCDTCGRTFASIGSLKTHKNTHMETRQFVCNFCGRGFNQMCHLREHINIHEGKKPWKCKICPKAFARRHQLKVHQRVHNGEKPYKCPIDQCERAYAHQIDLKRHKYSAHGIYTKKHVCLICSKVYSENKLLQKHLDSHRGK